MDRFDSARLRLSAVATLCCGLTQSATHNAVGSVTQNESEPISAK